MDNQYFNRLYPLPEQAYAGHFADLTNSYSIHFFAEGFSDVFAFDDAVVKVWKQFLEIAPFNLIKQNWVFLSSYYYWLPDPPNGSNLGPILVSGPAGAPTSRTNFNSYIWPNTSGSGPAYFIDFDRAKFLGSIENTEVPLAVRTLIGLSHLDKVKLKDYLVYHNPNPNQFQQNSISILLYPDIIPPSISIDGIEFDLGVEPGMKLYLLNASDNAGKFIARILAKAMGLYSESPHNPPQKTSPSSDEDKLSLEFAPNLVYLPSATNPYIPTWDFKWSNDVADDAYSSGIPVHNSPSGKPINQVTNTKVELWKGGGGFASDVYRSAEYCLMNSVINDVGSYRVKNAHNDFCPVCTNYITNLLGQANNNVFDRLITLMNQPLKFDEVNWNTKTVHIEKAPINYSNSFDSIPMGVTTEYWRFDVVSNASNILTISNIKVKNQQRPIDRIVEDVMSSINYENLTILFEGDTVPVDFPTALVFANNQATLEIYENGNSLQSGNLFQKGIKLTMEHDFGGCNVTVTLSAVFRGRQNDFDPGGAAYATKFYPQIQFSWNPAKINPKTIKSFTGHIVMDCNTHHADTNPTCLPTKMNFVEMFTDSNTGITSKAQITRKHKYRVRTGPTFPDFVAPVIPIAQWSFLFDYYRAMYNEIGMQDIYDETWTVVYGPNSATQYSNPRSLEMGHLNDPLLFPNNFIINKVQRQGAYDNIHVTGDMGMHESQPNMDPESYLYEGSSIYPPARLLSAPFCAEDCIHIHFRWGNFAKYLAPIMRVETSQFKGWNPSLDMSLKQSASEQPLTPPNQEVKIRIINPSAAGKSKKLIYQAVITAPMPGSKNVIFEQGAAYAVAANPFFIKLLKTFYALSSELICPDKMGLTVFAMDDYVFMRKLYARIRFAEAIPDTGMEPVSTSVPHAIVNNSGGNLENI